MHRLWATLFVIGLALVGGTSSATSGRFALTGSVTRVVDGDTLDVRLSTGKRERVRVIGIDAPELAARACYASDARTRAWQLAQGMPVSLTGDATQPTRDRYRRLLAYVQLPGRVDFGRAMLTGGHAKLYAPGRPFARVGAYRAAEASARKARRGLWTACAVKADLGVSVTPSPNPVTVGGDVTLTLTVANAGPGTAAAAVATLGPVFATVVSATAAQGSCAAQPLVTCTLGDIASGATVTVTIVLRTAVAGVITPAVSVRSSTVDPSASNNTASTSVTISAAPPPPPPPPPPSGNCHPSYPDVCIPPAPPDLDCGQIQHRNFRVRHDVPDPDPHGFDGDRDGIGCET